MRVAVCISGHMRSYTWCFQRLRLHMLKRWEGAVDVFVSTWQGCQDKANSIITEDDLKHAYAHYLKDYHIDDYSQVFPKNIHKDTYYNNQHPIVPNMASMWYKIHDCWCLMAEYAAANSIKYDAVIRFRPDLRLVFDVDLPSIVNISKSLGVIGMPKTENYGGINDQCFFGNRMAMCTIMNLHNYFEYYIKNENLNLGPWAEHVLLHHMHRTKHIKATMNARCLHYKLQRPARRGAITPDEKLPYR